MGTRLPKNNLEVNIQDVDPTQILNELHNLMHPQSAEKGLALEVSIADNAHFTSFKGDRELTRKALRHLADNAIKFTDKGVVVIGLKIKNNALVFFVRDTGIGIIPEYTKMLYEPFSQEDSAITRGHEGCGLGLPIASGIIKKLGGEIWVESEKHSGSTFFVSFPLPESQKPTNKNRGSASFRSDTPWLTNKTGFESTTTAEPVAVEPETSEKHSILLADDDDMALFLLETLIEEIDARIITATNGKEAVDAFRSNPDICMVIMDIKMPIMDGIEATRQIKAIRQDVPVIAVTAHAMSGDEYRIRAAGCDDYIAKPLSGKVLLEKIKNLAPKIVGY